VLTFDRRIRATSLLVACIAFAAAACQEPRRIPRVEPELANWTQPYRGLEGLKIHVFDTGSFELPEAVVYGGGSWFKKRRMTASAFVIEHPTAGLIVFDSGLSPALVENPARYAGRLVSMLLEFHVRAGQDLVSQMRAAGLNPDDVRYVVPSDLHFDHTGTLESFHNATLVVAAKELAFATAKPGWLPNFVVPEDFDDMTKRVEIDYDHGEPYATFFAHHDLLGDGSIILVDLRGHTPGSQGMIVRASPDPVLLAGDAAWVEESWRYAAMPLWADDPDLWWEQIWRIKKFVQLVPSAVVIPGHDLTPLTRTLEPAIVMHEFVPGDEQGESAEPASSGGAGGGTGHGDVGSVKRSGEPVSRGTEASGKSAERARRGPPPYTGPSHARRPTYALPKDAPAGDDPAAPAGDASKD
jgi:N-acyl homoserine lactone hydrolase